MLPIGGEPMLVRLHRRLRAAQLPCALSVRAPLQPQLLAKLNCEVIVDSRPGAGPLGALATAAEKAATRLLFAAAADMPNLNADFIVRLHDVYEAHSNPSRRPDAVMPVWPDGKVEPLAALYDRAAFLRGAKAALARGERKVTDALRGQNVVSYPVGDRDMPLLQNVNTPQEYESAVLHET